jgi:hypothetical protein
MLMNVTVEEKKLTDGSPVFSVMLDYSNLFKVEFDCVNEVSAWSLCSELRHVVDITIHKAGN